MKLKFLVHDTARVNWCPIMILKKIDMIMKKSSQNKSTVLLPNLFSIPDL